MKLGIDSFVLHAGIICDETTDPTGPNPGIFEHRIVDIETGTAVIDRVFDNVVEATLYLAALRPQLEAAGLPPKSAEH